MRQAQSLSGVAGHFVRARWRAEHLHGEALARFQDERFRATVNYALEHSAFYRNYWAGHDPSRPFALPTVGKSEMMAHFQTFNSLGISRERALEAAQLAETGAAKLDGLTVGLSSGTSGSRGLFLLSPSEQAAWTGTVLARVMHRLQRERVALFLRAGSDLYQGIGRGRSIEFRYFPLERDLEPHLLALNAFEPTLLIGPPSLLERLATAQQQGRLHVKPRRLIAVAEVMDPPDQRKLENVFQVPIHQIYQATEGFLAAPCAYGQLHLQEDIVAIQMGAIQMGTVQAESIETHVSKIYFTPVVTDLWRRVQPIVRYRLGDLLTLETEKCACGSSWRRVQVLGRTADLFTLEDASRGARTLYPDELGRIVLESSPQIGDYRAFQERPGHLRLHLEHRVEQGRGEHAALEESIRDALERLGFRGVQLEVCEGLPDAPPNVKRRRMVRL